MYINEIAPNTEVTIRAKLNNNESCFMTSSMEINEKILSALESKMPSKFVIVKPIVVENKLVLFDVQKILLDVEISMNQKCYVWKNVAIRSIELPTVGKVYMIVSNQDVTFENRRENFRVSVGIRGISVIGKNRVSTIVKDLSNNGVGLIVSKDTPCAEGNSVKLSFEDAKKKISFSADCTIVRLQNEGEKHILLGCVINNIRPDPSYYINMIQRDMLHKR